MEVGLTHVGSSAGRMYQITIPGTIVNQSSVLPGEGVRGAGGQAIPVKADRSAGHMK
jgi:hypothetical protein